MSEMRKIKVDITDFTILEAAAKSLGFSVNHNVPVIDYYGKAIGTNTCDLVIKDPSHRFGIGYRHAADGSVECVADFHGGYVDRTQKRLMPTYTAAMIVSRAENVGFCVTDRQENSNEITLRLRRY